MFLRRLRQIYVALVWWKPSEMMSGPTEAVITSAARLSMGGQQLRTGRGTGGRPEVDDSLSPGCRFRVPGGMQQGRNSPRTLEWLQMCTSGPEHYRVCSVPRCELPCTAAADPVYHRRPEKAIMRDLAAGKVWGISEGKELLEVSSSPPSLHNCTSVTALLFPTHGSTSLKSKTKTTWHLNLCGGGHVVHKIGWKTSQWGQ